MPAHFDYYDVLLTLVISEIAECLTIHEVLDLGKYFALSSIIFFDLFHSLFRSWIEKKGLLFIGFQETLICLQKTPKQQQQN